MPRPTAIWPAPTLAPAPPLTAQTALPRTPVDASLPLTASDGRHYPSQPLTTRIYHADTQMSGTNHLRAVEVTELHFAADGAIPTIDPFVK